MQELITLGLNTISRILLVLLILHMVESAALLLTVGLWASYLDPLCLSFISVKQDNKSPYLVELS